MWRSAYHRISDDSVSSFGGHATRDAAILEADGNMKNPDIDSVWVRDPEGHIVFSVNLPETPDRTAEIHAMVASWNFVRVQ